ncbi:flagellar basal body rod protein FlgB [bacterium]|nr:flagellar basal body rod protein FlgB [bacterium]
MTINRLFDSTSDLLFKSAQLRSQKAQVIASNIANLDTPDYKAQKFEFSDALRKASTNLSTTLPMTATHAGHFGHTSSIFSVQGHISTKENSLGGLDGNSVNLDQEMADQAINSSAYTRSIQMLKSKMSILKNAIVEGGK